jgi:hypothetical protein
MNQSDLNLRYSVHLTKRDSVQRILVDLGIRLFWKLCLSLQQTARK